MIGTYCILPVNPAVDFLIYSMWLANTDQTLQAKKSPTEHMAPLSSSLLLIVLVRHILPCVDLFGVYPCLCVCVCHFRVDESIRAIPAVTATKGKMELFVPVS